MSEEQFWHSNPRIIKVWEESWREEMERKNDLAHIWTGHYVMSAVQTALSQVLTPMFSKGKRSSAEYIKEPVRLFPMTEEEKKAEAEKMTQAFIAWENSVVKRFSKKPDM